MCCDHHFLSGSVFGATHRMKAKFHLTKRGLGQGANVLTGLPRSMPQAKQLERQSLSVGNLLIAIHADGILREEVAQIARVFGAGGDLGHAYVQEHFRHIRKGVRFEICWDALQRAQQHLFRADAGFHQSDVSPRRNAHACRMQAVFRSAPRVIPKGATTGLGACFKAIRAL